MDKLKTVVEWIKQLTEGSIALLALAVVLQLLFGPNVEFFPVDVVGNVVNITKSLGAQGLVGLVAVGLLFTLFSRKD